MKIISKNILFLVLLTMIFSVGKTDAQSRTKVNFGSDWEFQREENSNWEKVSIPHTSRIENLVVVKQFEGISTYQKKFKVKNTKGKKVFQLYSCTQCHGPEAKGQVGPGLVGPDYKYPKDMTNKGMFETVWHGTNGGMGAKGIGLMDPTDPKNGITPDELLKVIAWIRSMSKVTGNE